MEETWRDNHVAVAGAVVERGSHLLTLQDDQMRTDSAPVEVVGVQVEKVGWGDHSQYCSHRP